MQIPFIINGEEIILTSDEHNYYLAKSRERNRGEKLVTELEGFRFFADIASALNGIISMKIKASEAKTLAELRDDIIAARKEVLSVWQASA